MNPQQIIQKLWNYCNVLRDDGLSYGDYVEQLTYLLFLKMADKRTLAPGTKNQRSPRVTSGQRLCRRKVTRSRCSTAIRWRR